MGSFARVVDFTGWSGSVPRCETISFVCNDRSARTRLSGSRSPRRHRPTELQRNGRPAGLQLAEAFPQSTEAFLNVRGRDAAVSGHDSGERVLADRERRQRLDGHAAAAARRASASICVTDALRAWRRRAVLYATATARDEARNAGPPPRSTVRVVHSRHVSFEAAGTLLITGFWSAVAM
jgi:hypothetical protein